jgi:hypothetical protein
VVAVSVKVVWLRPLTEADRVVHGRAQSLWGIELDGVLQPNQFTNKRAATLYAREKGRCPHNACRTCEGGSNPRHCLKCQAVLA